MSSVYDYPSQAPHSDQSQTELFCFLFVLMNKGFWDGMLLPSDNISGY